MKDQVTALMEALRMACLEIEKLRQEKQQAEDTVDAIETILREPHVARAIQGLEPMVFPQGSPPLQPVGPGELISARKTRSIRP